MPTAYSYKRFSSERQARGDSLRRQTELASRYIAAHPELGLLLDTELSMTDEGMSAYKGVHAKKGAMAAFVRAVEDGAIAEGSYLLLESLDRFSREQPLDALPQLTALIKSGIVVVTLQDEKIYSYETTKGTDGTFALVQALITMGRAHEESAAKSKRSLANWEGKRERIPKGVQLTKRVPFWIVPSDDSDASKMRINEERAALVRRMIDLTFKGYGHASIAKMFNQEGIPAPEGERWHPSIIVKTLTKKALIGTLESGKQEFPGYYPPIIEEGLFTGLQLIEKRSGAVRNIDGEAKPLAGILKCVCGRNMKSQSRTGRIKKDGTRSKWVYAICSDAAIGKGCAFVAVPYAKLVDSALELLRKAVENMSEDIPAGYRLREIRHELQVLAGTEAEAYETFKQVKTEKARQEYLSVVAQVEALKSELATLQPKSFKKQVFEDTLVKLDSQSNGWWRQLVDIITINAFEKTLTLRLHGGTSVSGPILEW
jgi:DNA invertase Pin-like site-specific DNA recombinase